ncbi:MAG TPA: hypothetical protein VG937_25875 [Polyangiaceae bacterium]|nr:hypothetical protein [Polyangiaceae bacterium]
MTISNTPFYALLFFCAASVCGIAGCVSSDDKDSKGGSSGTGGSSGNTGGTSGNTGGGSATGGSGGVNANGAFPCAPPMQMITDFTYLETATSTENASFGDFTTTFSGGTFIYPTTGTYPLKSDVTKGNWHITGSVGDYSGVGLFFSGVNPATAAVGGCGKVDASAFKGIQFTISGSVAMGNTVSLNVGTAGDDVASAWLNAHKANATDPDKDPNYGRCMPAGASQYDGTCGAPMKAIPVTSTPTVVKVLWSELIGGKPEPTVNPKEITFVSWVLPPPAGVGTSPTPYDVDLTIDDLQFIP